MKVAWRHGALTSARRFMADQAGMRAINQAIAGLVDHPEAPDALSVAITAGCPSAATGCCTKWKQRSSASYGWIRFLEFSPGPPSSE